LRANDIPADTALTSAFRIATLPNMLKVARRIFFWMKRQIEGERTTDLKQGFHEAIYNIP
jgi:hypothetical protein